MRSEPKVRGEAGLLTIICLSHAEDVSDSATGGLAHNYQATAKKPEAEHTAFAIVLSFVIDRHGDAFEDFWCTLEIQSALFEGLGPLGWIERVANTLLPSGPAASVACCTSDRL